ncbi:histone acetyltransferase KAT6A isoform X2 [Denticeps clupeoides]|uniref:histone acetyltransferase KAT6A isoform X2 n=1 Tax=Denticeps clupeoides TaxID=299321 RepID=UPI0010A51CC3|nr:histone acetyltransferase KAT6A-like isoform X2 [Denticeps clupeoides]
MAFRAAWHRLGSMARRAAAPLSRTVVPLRHMAGLPGGSAMNVTYVAIGGGSLVAALVYAYKTVNSDSVRYTDRIAAIEARSKSEESEVGAAAADTETALTSSAPLESAVPKESAGKTATEEPAAEPVVAVEAMAEPLPGTEEAPCEAEVVEIAAEMVAVSEEPTAEAETSNATESSVLPVSDLLSTMKIMVGSTVEIAAASVGDRRMVSAVRMLEEKPSLAVELPDVDDVHKMQDEAVPSDKQDEPKEQEFPATVEMAAQYYNTEEAYLAVREASSEDESGMDVEEVKLVETAHTGAAFEAEQTESVEHFASSTDNTSEATAEDHKMHCHSCHGADPATEDSEQEPTHLEVSMVEEITARTDTLEADHKNLTVAKIKHMEAMVDTPAEETKETARGIKTGCSLM